MCRCSSSPISSVLEGGWRRLPRSDQTQISRAAAVWLTARGLLYAILAAGGFVFADTLARAWPWAIDPVEVRMFLGQPFTFILSGLAVLRGNLLWRRHRLPLLYLGALGVVQLAGLLALRTPYHWASPLGVILVLMFAEWIITPLTMLLRRRRDMGRRSTGDAAAVSPVVPPRASAARYGVTILGVVYLAIGLLGFLPNASVNPPSEAATYLLRHIAVNGPHNIVHILIGITGLAAARSVQFTRAWGITMGLVLLALFVVGLAQAALAGFPRDQSLLGLVVLNSAGHVFHLATGIVALIFGLTALDQAWSIAASTGLTKVR